MNAAKAAIVVFFLAGLDHQPVYGNWTLTFHDEFNGTTLDSSKWSTCYPGGGRAAGRNGEQQYYTDTAFSFPAAGPAGYLQINTSSEKRSYSQCLNSTCYFTSGMINTSGTFSQAFGYFEIRVKVPAGQGLWPAFWLLPEHVQYSEVPFEIDIMEAGYGGGEYLAPMYRATLHRNNYQSQEYVANANNYSDAFHTFAVNWEPESIRFYVDPLPDLSNPVYTVTAGIPSAPAFVIANLAIGGLWPAIGYPDTATAARISKNAVPLQIDYIRVYRNSPNGEFTSIPPASALPAARSGSSAPASSSARN